MAGFGRERWLACSRGVRTGFPVLGQFNPLVIFRVLLLSHCPPTHISNSTTPTLDTGLKQQVMLFKEHTYTPPSSQTFARPCWLMGSSLAVLAIGFSCSTLFGVRGARVWRARRS